MDSKLSLDTSDPEISSLVANWEDGQEYDVTLHIVQTAPGEFSVTSAKETETPAEEAAPTEESDTETPPTKGENPAIALVIKAGKNKMPMMQKS